jgi:hypothetical protein
MSRAVRIGVRAIAVAAIVVALAQLIGPAVAAKVVAGKVGRYGTVRKVSVKAWPAVKLLWREADEVSVDAGTLRLSPEEAVALLREGSSTDEVDARAQAVDVSGLRLRSVRFEKDGRRMRAEGTVSEADVAEVLPPGVGVALLGSEEGTVRVKVSGGLFGVGVSVEAVARAEDGKLVARPEGLLSGLKLTIFESGDVYVEGVEARALAGGRAGEGKRYELVMWARLRS